MFFGVTARAASGAAVKNASNVITSCPWRLGGSIRRPTAGRSAGRVMTGYTGAEDAAGWPTARPGMAQHGGRPPADRSARTEREYRPHTGRYSIVERGDDCKRKAVPQGDTLRTGRGHKGVALDDTFPTKTLQIKRQAG